MSLTATLQSLRLLPAAKSTFLYTREAFPVGKRYASKVEAEKTAFAKHAGYELLKLEAAASNTTAVNLYKKMGFVVYGERPLSLKRKSGDYYDKLLMVLDLTK